MIPKTLIQLRKALDKAFNKDTAYNPDTYTGGSQGHCYLVALLVQRYFGGRIVGTTSFGESHRFNRLNLHGIEIDVDLTADQFYTVPILARMKNSLYVPCKVLPTKVPSKGAQEKLYRLMERAGLTLE